MCIEKNFRPLPSYAPTVCRKCEPYFNVKYYIKRSYKKNKSYKWTVIAAKSIYTNEKQCLLPSSIDNPLISIAPPHFF